MIDLEANWIETCKNIGFNEPDIDLFRALCKRYSEPQRRYHTLQHLSECLALADQDKALGQHPAEVAYALWFHDAVYELDRHDNEQECANWARASLTAAGVQADVADRVSASIMATCHSDRPSSPDAQLVVDIDLAILAAAPDRFEEYERQIRVEYQHVPEQIFLTKRRAVLSSFLERPHIYLTPTYAQRFESAARHNLKSRI